MRSFPFNKDLNLGKVSYKHWCTWWFTEVTIDNKRIYYLHIFDKNKFAKSQILCSRGLQRAQQMLTWKLYRFEIIR